MKDYTVVVYETVSHTVEVQADSESDAYDEAINYIQSEEYNARKELSFEGYTDVYEATCWNEDEEEEEA